MYKIAKLSDAVQGYISITVSDGEKNSVYTVRRSVYEELGSPLRTAPLNEDDICTLRLADEYYRGKRAALSILSYGDNNAKTLFDKLRRRSVSEEICEEFVAEMISLGYVDEKRQLERLILEDSNRKLLGPRKITPRLLSKGYRLADIREVYSRLSESGEINPEENKERLLEKHLGARNFHKLLLSNKYCRIIYYIHHGEKMSVPELEEPDSAFFLIFAE